MRRDGRRRFGRAFAVHLCSSIDKTIQTSPTCTDLQQECARFLCGWIQATCRFTLQTACKSTSNGHHGANCAALCPVMEGMLSIGN